jgi:hypothetical protein
VLRFLLIVATSAPAVAPAQGAEVVSVAPLDSVLARHVRGGMVAYGGLARDPGTLLRFLASTATAHPERFDRAHQMAFWINTYNARVLEAVIRRPGISSVLDSIRARGFFSERRTSAGRSLSLDEIERDVLRAQFADARVHFVLNCGARSCPSLPGRALTAAHLERALSDAAKAFVADRSKNRWGSDGTLELSAIFDWYGADFVKAAGSVPTFVARDWSGTPRPTASTRVRFLPYDWSLNGGW